MELLCETPRAWVELAIDRFDEVLVDHAHCEKKAAASALSLLAAFPSVPGLARAMARLAREESGHLAQVLAFVEKRGLSLGRDLGDPYAERLRLLAAHLRDPELRGFYGRLASAEKGHGELFLRLAARCEGFDARLAEVRGAEAKLVRELPLRAAIH
ncbi:MAG: tRNA-(ms[2]io[6]A)-hydroxylase [Deltaproteobacteria bacterium]|nr:MAG: tRNA-(ms[2]io[6]A)-hydroxylase [Deltaproteobacteria bacterium]